jgi:hypothetical protein
MRSKLSSLHRDEGAGLNVALIAHNAGGDANNADRPAFLVANYMIKT